MNNLKTLIREYQNRHKKPDGTPLTQQEIAELANVDPATLSRYANNQIGSINLEIWQKLVNFFDVDGDVIFNMRPDTRDKNTANQT